MGADGGFSDWEQEAERRDRAADQRDQDAAAHDDGADERDRFSRRRDELASIRKQAAHEREKAALARDRAARARDLAAERRDGVADRRERPIDASQVGRFEQAAVNRELDASDRQAAVERAQHGYVPTPGGPSFRRVQALRGRAQESARATARATAGLVERSIQAKQRESTAHLACIEAYEQMATLQEGLGHPDQAAEARANAQRARELHRVAGAELAEYLARIKGVEDRRVSRRGEGTGRAGG